ncbi:MAG: PEGA domain-containing protein [Polyangia bacterium]
MGLLGLACSLSFVPEGLCRPRRAAKPAGAAADRPDKAVAPTVTLPEDGAQVRLQAAAQAQKAGRLDEAIAALEALYLDTRAPAALRQLGELARQQGRLVAAADLLRRYLDSTSLPPDDKEAQDIRQVLGGVTEPSIEAAIVGGRGWALRIDDRLVGILPLPGPVMLSPGAHRLVVEQAGKTSPSAAIELPADSQLEISLSLSPQQELRPVVSRIPTVAVLIDGPTEAWAAVREPADSPRLLDAIRTALAAKRSAAVRSERQGEALRRPEFARCEQSPECQARLGQLLHATYVLSFGPPRVDSSPLSSALPLRLLDTRTRQVAAERSVECPSCTAPVRAVRIGTAVYELLATAMSRPRGTLSITSQPPGAALRLNGEPRGPSPLQAEVFAGVYEIVAEQPGYVPSRTSLEVQPGQSATAELRLASAAPAAPPSLAPAARAEAGRRPLWRLIAGSSLLGAGVILVGFGASALAVNGRCKAAPTTTTPPPTSGVPTDPCLPVYETAGVGGGLVGAGAGAVLGGVLLIAWPPARR